MSCAPVLPRFQSNYKHSLNCFSAMYAQIAHTYLPFVVSPLLPGVPDLEQHELCSVKVEITRAV